MLLNKYLALNGTIALDFLAAWIHRTGRNPLKVANRRMQFDAIYSLGMFLYVFPALLMFFGPVLIGNITVQTAGEFLDSFIFYTVGFVLIMFLVPFMHPHDRTDEDFMEDLEELEKQLDVVLPVSVRTVLASLVEGKLRSLANEVMVVNDQSLYSHVFSPEEVRFDKVYDLFDRFALPSQSRQEYLHHAQMEMNRT